MRTLGLEGAWLLEPEMHFDERGVFHEWYQDERFQAATGHTLHLAQANCSTSRRGVIRGIHYADVPPGQAKYLTCVQGAVMDVIVDIRFGSPTFGRWEAVRLDSTNNRAVYVAEGMGHAFTALTENATVIYLCSTGYEPDREHSIHPLDPDLAIDWPDDIKPILSEKDAAAPTLKAADQAGLLPSYADCGAFYARMRQRPVSANGRPA